MDPPDPLLSPDVRARLELDRLQLLPELDLILAEVGHLTPERLQRRLERLRRRLHLHQILVSGLVELLDEDGGPPP